MKELGFALIVLWYAPNLPPKVAGTVAGIFDDALCCCETLIHMEARRGIQSLAFCIRRSSETETVLMIDCGEEKLMLNLERPEQ